MKHRTKLVRSRKQVPTGGYDLVIELMCGELYYTSSTPRSGTIVNLGARDGSRCPTCFPEEAADHAPPDQ